MTDRDSLILPDSPEDLLRTAAFGGLKARQAVFTSTSLPVFLDIIKNMIDQVDQRLSTYIPPDHYTAGQARGKLNGIRKMKTNLVALHQQIENVINGIATPERYYSLAHLSENPTQLLGMALKRIVSLPGTLRTKPDHAVALNDDLDVLLEAIRKHDEGLAESLEDIAAWIEKDADNWIRGNRPVEVTND